MPRLLSPLAVGLLAAAATAQLQVVIPAGAATRAGNTSNAFPWGNNASAWGGLRLMCVYDAANFTSQNINGPILINQLKWRPDNNAGAVAGGTYPTATVQLSTAPIDYTAVTTNYATNHGANVVTAYSGPVVHTATPGAAGWTTSSWCVDIALTTPFLYDPSAGDLVIDVDYPTGSTAQVGQMDVEGTGSMSARVFASSMYPIANGTTQNHGVVVEVGYVPPSGYAYSSPYGDGCVDQASASFYELFANGTFDLSNAGLQLVPTGNGYAVLPLAAPTLFTPTSTAITMADDSVTAALPLGFTLNYPGGSTTSVYASSNGFVWAQSSTNNGCCAGSPSQLLSAGARWCALWNDLNPGVGGAVHFDTDPANGVAYVTFLNVPEFGTTNLNTFQYAFFSSGAVELRFGACSVLNHQVLTGWSPGANNLDPGSIDLSATPVLVTSPDLSAIVHSASARPVIGSAISLDTTNIAATGILGATLFGLSELNPGIPLPGMPGCSQYVSIDASQIFLPNGGTGSTPFVIPNVPSLAAVEIKTQTAVLMPGVNLVGAVTSNGLKHVLDIN